MPVNKAARYRFEIIDECLRTTTRKWSLADILQYVNRRLITKGGEGAGIKDTQLRNDLKDMKIEYEAPIEKVQEGRKHYYIYTKEFSLKDIPIPEEGLQKLQELCEIVRGIPGLPYVEEVLEFVSTIGNKNLFAGGIDRIIHFEDSQPVEGTEYLMDLYDTIVGKRVLKLHYKKFTAKKANIYTVHPYALKQYQSRWYLWCYSEEGRGQRTFGLDRIRNVQVIKGTYRENTSISIEQYFENVIGVTVPEGAVPEEIALWVSPVMAPYVMSKRWHKSQFEESYDDTGLYMTLRLIVNHELISLILSLGENIKVIKPASLVERLKEIISNIKYE